MKASEALKEVSKHYVPGVVAFYEKMNPDPWFDAHERLNESLLKDKSEEGQSVACKIFVDACVDLIDGYKSRYPGGAKLSDLDAFFIGDEDRVRKLQSQKYRECAECESKKDLVLVRDKEDVNLVYILCKNCKTKNKS